MPFSRAKSRVKPPLKPRHTVTLTETRTAAWDGRCRGTAGRAPAARPAPHPPARAERDQPDSSCRGESAVLLPRPGLTGR